MDYYQLSSASFADEISVQRSSISHLLSGRNKPSLEFVLKVTERFSEVDLYWLLYDKGSFPKQEKTTPTTSSTKNQSSFKETKAIDRIIIFYTDGTFENYTP